MSFDQTKHSKSWLLILTVTLIALGALLYMQRLTRVKPARPAAWGAVEQPYPKSTAPFSQPDFLDGPELQLIGNPQDFESRWLRAASDNDSANRHKFRMASDQFTEAPPAIPADLKSVRTTAIADQEYVACRQREVAAYEKLTHDPPQIKELGVSFLQSYLANAIGRTSNNPNAETLEKADAVLAAGTKDPLVRTYAAFLVWADRSHDQRAFESVLDETLKELASSGYPRIALANARRWLYRVEQFHKPSNTSPRWGPCVAAIIQWLEQDSSDVSLRTVLCERLSAIWDEVGREQRAMLVAALFQSEKVDPWIVHLLAGAYYRGDHIDEFIILPSRITQRSEPDDFDRAAMHLRQAWALAPELPQAAAQMISITSAGIADGNLLSAAAADQRRERPDAYCWFRLAIGAQSDFLPAYRKYFNALSVDRGGSIEQRAAFIKACIETRRFNTEVPFLAIEFIDTLIRYELKPAGLQPRDANVAVLLQLLADERETYRREHPQEALKGDDPYYRSRFITLLELLESPQVIAEVEAAHGQFDQEYLLLNGEPRQYQWNRLAAGLPRISGELKRFDEKLRIPWSDAAPPARLDELAAELADLEAKANLRSVMARNYFRDARQVIAYLRTFAAGDWVTIDLGPPYPGFDIAEEPPAFDRSNPFPKLQYATARLMAPFCLPLRMEAVAVPLEPMAGIRDAGFSWRQIGFPWGKFQSRQMNFGVFNPSNAENAARGDSYGFGFGDSLGDQFNSDALHQSGGHRLQLTLWPDAFEGTADQTKQLVRLREPPLNPQGNLVIHELFRPITSDESRIEEWRFPLSSLRIRKATGGSPLPDSAPLAQREAFWELRFKDDSQDIDARRELGRIRLEQGRLDEVLKLTEDVPADSPDAPDFAGIRGRALFTMRRYAEAKPLLEIAAAKQSIPPDTPSQVALAELLSAAPDESLHDLQKSVNLATSAKNQTGTPESNAAQAVAFAAHGRFEDALRMNLDAIRGAKTPDERARYEVRQKLYEKQQRFMLPK